MKTSKRNFVSLSLIMIMGCVVMYSCKKDNAPANNNGRQHLSIYLGDDPALFDKLLIDIRYVEVKIDTNMNHDEHFGDDDRDEDDDKKDHDKYGKWDTLSIRSGVYDVLQLRNGLDTLLASGAVPTGKIGKIRITLGPNNSVVKDSITYPLQLADGVNHYLYLKLDHHAWDEPASGNLALWLDFDAARSIWERNGKFYLKPVIRFFAKKNTGEIAGKVLPRDARALVFAINGSDTSTAKPEDEGRFEIRGLKAGTYSLFVKAQNGYRDTSISNISVSIGKDTKLNTITLHK